ncbi:MAG: magnesium transporter [Myxococcales bacterium]|nr:magnesium transporter [Myxococcales bacterium]
MSAPTEDDAPKSALPLADLSELDRALRPRGPQLAQVLKTLRPADVGRDLSRRTVKEGVAVLRAADDRRAAAILRATHHGVAARLITELDPPRAGALLARLTTDRRIEILSQLEPKQREALEQGLSPEDQRFIQWTLSFPEGSVARHLSPSVWQLEESATVRDALQALQQGGERIEVAPNLYVIAAGKLVGVVPLREIAVANPDARLDAIMVRDPISVRPDTELSAAAEIIQTHDFLSLPATDAEGKLLGAVRVDDLLDAALERAGTAVLNQGGVAGKVAGAVPYFLVPLHRVVRARITWLILLFVAETLTGTVLRAFEDELAKVVALSFFVPLIIGTGGNAGSQTVSTIIRALALGEVRVRDVGRVIARELSAGVMLGTLLGGIAFGRAQLWGVGADLALCVAITIFVVCVWANFVGSMIPLGAHALKIDPTVVSGPMITTLVDASGLFIYLTVAHLTIAKLAGG